MSTIRVKWKSNGDGASSYDLYRGTSASSGSASLLSAGVLGNFYDDTTASLGTAYWYWVKAVNASGTSGFSPAGGPITPTAAGLAKPTGLLATLLISGGVTVTWNTVSGATRYDVYRNTTEDSGTASAIASNVTLLTYADNTATANTHYFYWVKAKDAGSGVSEFSLSATGIAASSIPSAPAGVTASDTQVDQITITWSASAGAAQYAIYVNTVNNSATATLLDVVTALSYVHGSLAAGVTLWYWIKASNHKGLSAFSTGDSGTTQASIPAAPGSVTATRAVGKIIVGAATSALAITYSVWRATTNSTGAATQIISGLASPTYDDTSAIPETTYFYWWKATNAAGTSGFSATPASAAAQIVAPTGVSATTNIIGSVTVSWSAVANRDSYIVLRNTVNNPATAATLATGITATSYSDTSGIVGTSYFYWVQAVKASTPSPYSTVANGNSITSTPPAVSATTDLYDRITVSWSTVAGASVYVLYWNTVNNFGTASILATKFPPTTTHDHTGTAPTVPIYYWITVTVNSVISAPSAVASGYVLGVPSAPTGVVATDGSTAAIGVSWNAVAGAETYEVWRATTNNSAAATLLIPGVGLTSITDTSVPDTATYWYFIKAVNDAGPSAFSTGDSGYATAPAAPTGVNATDTLSDKIRVTWNLVSGAGEYEVWINSVNNSATASFFGNYYLGPADDTSIPFDQVHYYWVKAKQNSLVSAFSLPDSGVRLSGIPDAPTGLIASDDVGTQIDLTWDAVPTATIYRIFRNTVNNSGTATQIDTSFSTNRSDFTAAIDTTYYYWVKAENAYGTSGFSSPDTGRRPITLPSPPTGVSATDGNGDTITVTWDAVVGATSYDVYRGTSPSGAFAVRIALNIGVLTYDDITPTNTTTYYYFVVAKNVSGSSVLSAGDSGYASEPGQTSITGGFTIGIESITVNWSAPLYARYYTVWRNTVNDFSSATPIDTFNTGLSFEDNTCPFNVSLFYWVTAHNDVGQGLAVGSATFLLGVVPSTPAIYGVGGGTGNSFIQWSPSSGATNYDILVSDDPDPFLHGFASHDQVGNVTSHTWNPSGASADGYFPQYYAVRGTNRFSASAWSGGYGPIYQP